MPAARVVPQATGGSAAPAGNYISPEERTKYAALFAASGPVGGLLDGKGSPLDNTAQDGLS